MTSKRFVPQSGKSTGYIAYPPHWFKHWGPLLLIGTLLLSACTARPETHRRTQLIMGTNVEITAVSRNAEMAEDAITAGFEEIRRLDRLLSTYKESSEISRINRSAGNKPVAVSPEVLNLIREAVKVADMTGGGFNIAIGPAIALWGVSENPRIPSGGELEAVRPLVDYRNIRVDDQSRTVYLPKAGMRIDLGGIGKGYAADRAEAVMRRHGVSNGIVAVAGDLKVFGKRADGQPFRIAIRHPRRDAAPLASLPLADEGVSTSGDYERYFVKDGVRYHHIIDPETLRPARRSQSVTVVSKEAVLTDALSTGIFVLGPEKGMALIERLPDTEGVIVDAEGRIMVSSGLKSRLELIP